jgi:outer membrane protein OmpA-like peptidoglycan-associated protein
MQGVLSEQDRLRREQESLTVSMASDVLFTSGSASLYPGGSEKLRNFAAVLNRYPRTLVHITGHTDSRGSEESNLDLSLRRAQSVASELTAAGVSQTRLSTRGLGESQPIATNDTPEGRAQNRRVDINVVPDEGLRHEESGAVPAGGAEPR